MATRSYFKPGLDDSAVSLTEAELGKKINAGDITEEQRLVNSGYVQGAPGAAAPGGAAPGTGATSGTSSLLTTTSPDNPVSSTTGIRQGVELTKGDASTMIPQLDSVSQYMDEQFKAVIGSKPFGESDDGKNRLAELDAMRKGLGMLSPDDQAQIDAAGTAGGREYDPLIEEAKEQKERGLPKAVIGAGENGGFMNTQYAGAAALVPTKGENFIGAGGELEHIQGVYDRNISMLQSKKLEAIAAAKAAARQALQTGKRQNLQDAREAFELARSLQNEGLQLAKEKVDAVSRYEKLREERVGANLEKLGKISSIGGEIPKELMDGVDAVYGKGFSGKYLEANKAATEAKNDEQDLDAFKKITDILKNYPAGKKISIGGQEYEALGSAGDNQIFKEEDAYGNVTFVTVDKRTGKVVSTAKGGTIGSGQKWARSPSGGSGGDGGGTETSSSSSSGTEEFEDWMLDKGITSAKTENILPYNVAEQAFGAAGGIKIPAKQYGGTVKKDKVFADYQKDLKEKSAEKEKAASYSTKTLKKAIGAADRAKMIDKGLNPENKEDMYRYLTKVKQEKKTSSKSTKVSSNPFTKKKTE